MLARGKLSRYVTMWVSECKLSILNAELTPESLDKARRIAVE